MMANKNSYLKNKKTITIGAGSIHPLLINRFGFGTMQLTGDFVWGEPKNRAEALQILQHTRNKGIHFLDTADYYGQDVTNRLIAEALYPYTDELIICSKVGVTRKADKSWHTFDKPKNLRTSVERNLKTLKLDQIKLVHLRITPGSDTRIELALNTMFELQAEGKILHIGLSNVSPKELTKALTLGKIASVENAFGYHQRESFIWYHQSYRGMQEVMDLCIDHKIPMIPFWSLQQSLPHKDDKINAIAKKYQSTIAQIHLAWLLHYNDLLLPIPGTSKLVHFEENIKAKKIELTADDMKYLG